MARTQLPSTLVSEVKMRNYIIIFLIFFILISGWSVFIEIDKRNFIESLPQPPPQVKLSATMVTTSPTPNAEESIPLAEESIPLAEESTTTEQTTDITDFTQPSTAKEDDFDWREDDTHTHVRKKADPWQQENEQQENESQSNLRDLTPQEYYRDVWLYKRYNKLLERHGDIPEVHKWFEITRKNVMGNPLTMDEVIEHYSLEVKFNVVNPRVRANLLNLVEELKTIRAEGGTFEHEVQFSE